LWQWRAALYIFSLAVLKGIMSVNSPHECSRPRFPMGVAENLCYWFGVTKSYLSNISPMDCSLCPCQTVWSDLGKHGDHTSTASASSRMHISALSSMRHWIWLSVAPRLCHRWCHAFMVSRQRASAPRGSRTLQVSGKAFLLYFFHRRDIMQN